MKGEGRRVKDQSGMRDVPGMVSLCSSCSASAGRAGILLFLSFSTHDGHALQPPAEPGEEPSSQEKPVRGSRLLAEVDFL